VPADHAPDLPTALERAAAAGYTHAPGARKQRDPPASGAPAGGGWCAGRWTIGRSRDVHLAVDGRGRPLSVLLTAGQDGDNPQLLDSMSIAKSAHRHPMGAAAAQCR
jgi:hypothetical protein